MYLHLGQEKMVRMKDIIGIFDLENSSVSKITRNYLANAQKNGEVINVTDEIPKSFVICRENNKTKVYISQISPATLRKRTGFIENISNVG